MSSSKNLKLHQLNEDHLSKLKKPLCSELSGTLKSLQSIEMAKYRGKLKILMRENKVAISKISNDQKKIHSMFCNQTKKRLKWRKYFSYGNNVSLQSSDEANIWSSTRNENKHKGNMCDDNNKILQTQGRINNQHIMCHRVLEVKTNLPPLTSQRHTFHLSQLRKYMLVKDSNHSNDMHIDILAKANNLNSSNCFPSIQEDSNFLQHSVKAEVKNPGKDTVYKNGNHKYKKLLDIESRNKEIIMDKVNTFFEENNKNNSDNYSAVSKKNFGDFRKLSSHKRETSLLQNSSVLNGRSEKQISGIDANSDDSIRACKYIREYKQMAPFQKERYKLQQNKLTSWNMSS